MLWKLIGTEKKSYIDHVADFHGEGIWAYMGVNCFGRIRCIGAVYGYRRYTGDIRDSTAL